MADCPAALWVYLKLPLRGRRLQDTHGDVNQLGGDVLIDPDGIVRLHHVGSGPADRPAVESILQLLIRLTPRPCHAQLVCENFQS